MAAKSVKVKVDENISELKLEEPKATAGTLGNPPRLGLPLGAQPSFPPVYAGSSPKNLITNLASPLQPPGQPPNPIQPTARGARGRQLGVPPLPSPPQ